MLLGCWGSAKKGAPVWKGLWFEALEDGSTVLLYQKSSVSGFFDVSFDEGNTWTTVSTADSPTFQLQTGQRACFKCHTDNSGGIAAFSGSGKLSCGGRICSLIDSSKVPPKDTNKKAAYLFSSVFSGMTSLVDASKLELSDALNDSCTSFYYNLFSGCTGLISPPILPKSTWKAAYDYYPSYNFGMFYGMFRGCTSLVTPPAIPQNIIVQNESMRSMFSGCTSLTSCTWPSGAFSNNNNLAEMYSGCTSLTSVDIPITSTPSYTGQYSSIFYGCTNLSSITVHFSAFPNFPGPVSGNPLYMWTSGVSQTGVFRCPANFSKNAIRGDSGIPTGWTVVNI